MSKNKKNKNLVSDHVRRVTNLIVDKIMIAGSNVMQDVDVQGLEAIRLHARTERERLALTDSVNTVIRRARRDWQFVIFVFSQQDGEPVFSYDISVLNHCNAVELDRITSPMVRDKVEELADDNAISYGWVAFPSLNIDVDAMILPLEEYFRQKGCYDLEKRKGVVLSKKLEGLETKRLVEEYQEVFNTLSDDYPAVVGLELAGHKHEFHQTTSLGESGFTVMLKDPMGCLRYAPVSAGGELAFRDWVRRSVDPVSKTKADAELRTFFEQFRIDTKRIDAFSLSTGTRNDKPNDAIPQ